MWQESEQEDLPGPCRQRLIQYEYGRLVVAVEKLDVENIRDLFIEFMKVDQIGRHHRWFTETHCITKLIFSLFVG